jgi:hypothetical protein
LKTRQGSVNSKYSSEEGGRVLKSIVGEEVDSVKEVEGEEEEEKEEEEGSCCSDMVFKRRIALGEAVSGDQLRIR